MVAPHFAPGTGVGLSRHRAAAPMCGAGGWRRHPGSLGLCATPLPAGSAILAGRNCKRSVKRRSFSGGTTAKVSDAKERETPDAEPSRPSPSSMRLSSSSSGSAKALKMLIASVRTTDGEKKRCLKRSPYRGNAHQAAGLMSPTGLPHHFPHRASGSTANARHLALEQPGKSSREAMKMAKG
ncbi:unnamed protein product [Boreogadus saida]